jgi:hypothetical protein
MSVDAVGNDSVRAARLVLVDQRGPLAVMPHPGDQITTRSGTPRPVR